ncbi:hypothetical protein BC835DRAFT_1482828 [Cytidiella melzeri]|nr:hypothetical protein BC835DRAFT_1482828 [Cytidiella melzeri]
MSKDAITHLLLYPTMSSILRSAMQWANQTASQKVLCENCGINPKFVENGYQHRYCGKTCARNGSGSRIQSCLVASCREAPKAAHGGCCCDGHLREAVRDGKVQACLHCHTMPQTIRQLCRACERRRRAKPCLREVDISELTFTSVSEHFLHEWREIQAPVVTKIVGISSPQEVKSSFEAYRRKLDSKEQLRDLRTYHASQCICDFGVNELTLCSWRSCGICCIIKSSFAVLAFDVEHNNGSFGDGIYSYTNPALADKFATSSTSSPYRAMIACDVAISAHNDSQQVTDGERVFVANCDAILPAYVILYSFIR